MDFEDTYERLDVHDDDDLAFFAKDLYFDNERHDGLFSNLSCLELIFPL